MAHFIPSKLGRVYHTTMNFIIHSTIEMNELELCNWETLYKSRNERSKYLDLFIP